MSRAGEGGRLKKRNCCATCSIVCLIILVVFLAALYGGGSILFKTYVSPHIGGLTLNDAIALAANVLSGKEAETTYSEEDLDSFYSGLSEAMFLSDKSEDELEYELVPEEKRATLATGSSVAAAAEEDGSAYDEDAAYDAFCLKSKADRYALLSDDVKGKITLAEYSALAGASAASVAAREKVGLKPYRLSVESLLGDMEFGAEDFSMDTALEKSLSSLEFNFDTLEAYDINNAAAATNEKFTTFSVNGKEVSAFINDLLTYFLGSENSPLTSSLKESIPVNVDLTKYFKVASVTILNTPLATAGEEALYDQKDTALSMSISMKLRDLVVAVLETEEIKEQLSAVPSFVIKLIPKLVPKNFSLHATVYPLAPEGDKRELVIMVNKKSEKNAKRISTLLNALLSKEGEEASETFLGGINNTVVSTFSSVNNTVKINFVPSKDSEGKALKDDDGNTYAEMKIMTWETVLSLIDKDGKLSAHDVFTMLKCLYISKNRPAELVLSESEAAFKSDMSAKYGVSSTYLDEHNIFSTDDLGGMVENINLSSIDYTKSNDVMRVKLPAEALAAFMKKMVTKEDSSEVAAAEEDSGDTASLLKGADLKICGIEIKKVKEEGGTTVYSFEILFSADIAELLSDKLPDEGIAGSLSHKILPKQSSYFGVMIYLSEYQEGDKLLHKVGKDIDSPAEGVASAWSSKVRINDFTYAETTRVFDALDTFMEVVSGSSFKIESLTGSIEDAIADVLESLAGNDFNLALRLYEAEGTEKGGVNLPSIYELIESLVKPKLEESETFTHEDAKDVLYMMYEKEVSMEKTFNLAEDQDQATEFLDDVNDKYYIVKDCALTVSDLFGDGAGNLSDKIKVDSIYFKYNEAEAAKWEGEKASLYADSRTANALRVTLNGSEVAALVKDSKMIPKDMISSFGTMEILGAAFKTEEGKTYLTFHIKLLFHKEAKEGEGEEAVKYSNLFPANGIKLTAKVLLYAPLYTETAPRYQTQIKLNDDDSAKAFLLLRALGGSDLSEKTISDKITDSLSKTFDALEDKIPLYFSNAGTPFIDGDEECIKIADLFTFLIKETTMKDVEKPILPEFPTPEQTAAYEAAMLLYEAAPTTDPQDLAERLRGFGAQDKEDKTNAADYSWVTDLKLFTATDEDYIYTNMQRAYFLLDKPEGLDSIYGSENNFNSKFATIKEDKFNLQNDLNGLFYYDGAIMNLKVSDKALGVIIDKKESATIAAAVSGEGMSAKIVSLKIKKEGGKVVLESGVLISFDGSKDYHSTMPIYFFAIAKTVRTWNDTLSKYEFTTTVTLNNETDDETEKLFANISALGSKGMNVDSFKKATIEEKLNTTIGDALSKLPANVTFDTFTAADLAEYANAAYAGDHVSLTAGENADGYIAFPSVYYYMIENLITKPEAKAGLTKPEDVTEAEMRSMILSLHAADDKPAIDKEPSSSVTDLITNPKDAGAFHTAAFTGGNPVTDSVVIASDRYLAGEISSRFTGVKINGNINLENALQQTVVLRADGASDAHDEWASVFYTGADSYAAGDNYLVATAITELNKDAYKTGDTTNLLPDHLWFTVLADLDDKSKSKGLLYGMSHRDMELFEFILAQNSTVSFRIDTIAEEFAEKIKDAVGDYAGLLTISYKLASDDFTYYASYADTSEAAKLNAKDGVQALRPDDKANGVGYVVLSH